MLNMKDLKLEECFHFHIGYLPDLLSGIFYIPHQYTRIIFVKNGMTVKAIHFCFFLKFEQTNKFFNKLRSRHLKIAQGHEMNRNVVIKN